MRNGFIAALLVISLLVATMAGAGSVWPSRATAATGGIIASDGFESGNWLGGPGWLAGWETYGSAVVPTDTPHAGSQHLRMGGWAKRQVNLSGKSNLRLQFWARAARMGAGDWAKCEVSSDGKTWWTVKTWTSEAEYHPVDIDLSPYVMSSTFWIRFDGYTARYVSIFESVTYLYIDDVNIVQDDLSGAPTNVFPDDGATGVDLSPSLGGSPFSAWNTGASHVASQWQVTLANSSYLSPVYDSGAASKSTTITLPSGVLGGSATYYWRVRYQDSTGAWSAWSRESAFTTIEAVPPSVNSFKADKTSVATGEKIRLSYSVSDSGGSGLKQVELWQGTDTDGDGQPNWPDSSTGYVEMRPLAGQEATGNFDVSLTSAGTFWYGIHVLDNAGNMNDETNSATDGQPGVFGPVSLEVVAPAAGFAIGDRVITTETIHVRTSAAVGNNLVDTLPGGNIPKGSTGKVVGGPELKDNHIWWKIEYDACKITGWSAAEYLVLAGVPDRSVPAYFLPVWVERTINWTEVHKGEGLWYDKEDAQGFCLQFVANAFMLEDEPPVAGHSWRTATEAAGVLPRFDQEPQGWEHAPKGAVIFFAGKGANTYGHVGIYLGNGKMVHSHGTVKETTVAEAQSKGNIGCYIGWSYPPEGWRPNLNEVYSIDTSLNIKSQATAVQLDAFIKNKGKVWTGNGTVEHDSKDSPLVGLGQYWVEAGNKYGVDSVYLMAHAIEETGWGFSKIGDLKYNIYGFRAFDVNPMANAQAFASYADCINQCASYIKTEYLTVGGKYYHGPTLRGMNVEYATNPNWADNIAGVMNQFAAYSGQNAATAELSGIHPGNAKRGQHLTLTITGTNLAGAIEVSFGPGVTVEGVSAVSDTQIKVEITVDGNAAPGMRDVSVTTPSGTATITDGFEVVDGGGGGICSAGAPGAPSGMTPVLGILGLGFGVWYWLVRRSKRTERAGVQA